MELRNAASIPRAERILRKVTCGPGDSVGACVCIIGGRVAGRHPVTTVDITNWGAIAVGMLIKKTSPTEGVVLFHGPVRGLHSGLTPGRVYTVGFSGQIVSVPPSPFPGQRIFVQSMGWALDTDEFLVSPMPHVTIRG